MGALKAYAPGKCSACAGTIRKGEEFAWGKERGQRVHSQCQVAATPVEVTPVTQMRDTKGLSEYQRAICDAVWEGEGNFLVEALAGTGKTFTIERAARGINRPASIKYVVFNKRNADEAKERMPSDVDVSTWHSCCYRALAKTLGLGRKSVDKNKVRSLLAAMVDEHAVSEDEADRFGPGLLKLVGLAKSFGIGAGLLTDEDSNWEALIDHFGVEFSSRDAKDDGGATGRCVEIARALLARSNATLDVVDYDDQLYLAVRLHVPLPTYDYVFVDEAQDTAPIQRAVLRMMMTPESRLVAVGDSRQAIYGFRGADSDAMHRIREEFGCSVLNLPINYRCSRAVIEAAREDCPELQWCETAPEGSVTILDTWKLEDFERTDAVLCRVNAPLVSLAYRLIGRGIGCTILGRDIGEGLVNLIKKQKVQSVDDLEDALAAYMGREVAKWTAKGQEDKAQTAVDKVESIIAAIDALPEGERTIAVLIARIEGMFSDQAVKGLLTLSTGHKSKGLEWDRVFILDPHTMPSKWARQEWQMVQEANIRYVCRTRARKDLFYLERAVIAA